LDIFLGFCRKDYYWKERERGRGERKREKDQFENYFE